MSSLPLIHSGTADSSYDAQKVFNLQNDSAYLRWRDQKLDGYEHALKNLFVEIRDFRAISLAEKNALLNLCTKTNMALYVCNRLDGDSKDAPRSIVETLGLKQYDGHLCADNDGITPLHVSEERQRQEYIPYTDKPINWHTDGYYNLPDQKIRSMLLHCAMPAAEGGENALMDHEIAYLLLREKNPEYIAALMQEDAMTVPPNIDKQGNMIRGERVGPVFSIVGNRLHMRYTIRARFIEWKDDPLVREAAAALHDILDSDSPYIVHHRMQKGQGLICNNVLHKRSGFRDDAGSGQVRLMYRARFYDRLAT